MGHPRARFDELTVAGGGANPQLVAHSSSSGYKEFVTSLLTQAGEPRFAPSFTH